MQYVSLEEKNAFLSAEQKYLKLTFDDGTVIENEDIAMESMSLEQSVSDEEELVFGKCSAAEFKIKIYVTTKKYKNFWFNATIKAGEYEQKLGRFKVYTDNMTSDRLYRDIVAYDSLFWATNTDVTEWYNSLTFPISQKDFRDSLFDYLEIEQEEVVLPNDNIEFNKTVEAENFTGLTVLQALCEINAAWGVINHNGKFKYARMRTHEHDSLYPRDDLFPNDNLFPDDIYDDKLLKANYYQGTLKYEEYDTQPISKVTIREDSEDLGYSYGTDGNTYVIENNFLLYGASDEILHNVAKNFYDYAQYIAYTPSELKCKGAPWREVGDLLRVVADKRTITIPIFNRKLSGITALKDTYIAKGTETYGELENSPTEQLKQLRSRTNKITRSLDETKSEITKIEKNIDENYSDAEETKSLIRQASDEINLEVAKKVSEDELIAKINISPEIIKLKGNRIIIESDNFTLTEDGNIEMLSGKIKIEGKIRKTASDYTADDTERANNISLGLVYPTVEDLERLDVNGDGLIDVSDIIIINNLLKGKIEYYDIPTSIEINPLLTQSVLKTKGVSIGMNGAFFQNANLENAYMKDVYVMNQGGGFYQGATGTFATADGKTINVINGIITTIS